MSLSVSDFDRSVSWYCKTFDAEVLMDEPAEHRHAAVLRLPQSDLLIGICQFYEGQKGRFDPTRLGLDHFAFSVADRKDLDLWARRLDDLGVPHSGPIEVPTGAILNFKDPDGIALALMWRR